jgi:hypothetical protein
MNYKYIRPMVKYRKIIIQVMVMALLWSPVTGQVNPEDSGKFRAGEKHFQEIVNADGKSCVECHYFIEPDTINWNPSAMDLSGRVEVYKAEGLGQYFKTAEGDVIKAAHAELDLTVDQEGDLIKYLDHLQTTPYVPGVPVKWRMILFIGLFVLLILLSIEKNRIRKIPKMARRILGYAAWIVILAIVVQDALGFNLSKDYAPVQPIKFSHSIHATDNQIDCNYCHPGVLKGANAGIPPVSLCMNCHKHVVEGTRTGKFEIRKVVQAANDSIPIRWVRIHALPDFTYFNHMQHVTIGGVECITCHGEVENMHIVKQTEDLSMGWCIKCHDETKVDFSNVYYKTYYPALNDSLVTGRIDSIMVSDINGRECSVCHY